LSAPDPLSVSLEDSLDLVGKARRGYEGALNELLARHRERLRRIVRVRMGVEARRAADSMDIAQETLLVAAWRMGDFEPRDHAAILRWLVQIAERQITDLVDRERAAKRDGRRTRSLEGGDTQDLRGALEPAGREPTPSLDLSRREFEELYDGCVAELPERERKLVVKHEYEDASWESIARDLGRELAVISRRAGRPAAAGAGRGSGRGSSPCPRPPTDPPAGRARGRRPSSSPVRRASCAGSRRPTGA